MELVVGATVDVFGAVGRHGHEFYLAACPETGILRGSPLPAKARSPWHLQSPGLFSS
jgi:hypothetical protein